METSISSHHFPSSAMVSKGFEPLSAPCHCTVSEYLHTTHDTEGMIMEGSSRATKQPGPLYCMTDWYVLRENIFGEKKRWHSGPCCSTKRMAFNLHQGE